MRDVAFLLKIHWRDATDAIGHLLQKRPVVINIDSSEAESPVSRILAGISIQLGACATHSLQIQIPREGIGPRLGKGFLQL
jgi:hypothetical protein